MHVPKDEPFDNILNVDNLELSRGYIRLLLRMKRERKAEKLQVIGRETVFFPIHVTEKALESHYG